MNHIYEQPNFGENFFSFPNLYSQFVRELPSGSKMVEVGCWKGKSVAYLAVEIINSGKDIKVDAVDTWEGSPTETVLMSDPYVRTGKLYQLFVSNIAPVSSVVTPVKLPSVEAAKRYEDESLDVVFIDACHTYDCVKEDIAAWLPKVKKGGYLAGHDYYTWETDHDGVRQAVDETFGNNIHTSEWCWIHRIQHCNL
jgi:hypothetical protein